MAKIEENFSMQGMSGKVGNIFVYRQRGGKTIVAKTPHRSTKKTQKQEEANKRFKAASIYAKNALLDVASPYNMAMADYLRPPVIDKINAEAYTGSASGEKIIIEADDKFKVISLKVKITKSNGSLIEEGQASLSEGKWVYTTTAANASPTGDKITVIATDRTGNSTTKEITL